MQILNICLLFVIAGCVFWIFYRQDELIKQIKNERKVELIDLIEKLLQSVSSQNNPSPDLFQRLLFIKKNYNSIFGYNKEIKDFLNNIANQVLLYSVKMSKNELDEEMRDLRVWAGNQIKEVQRIIL